MLCAKSPSIAHRDVISHPPTSLSDRGGVLVNDYMMPSFITSPSCLLPLHSKTIPTSCALKKRIFPRALSRCNPMMQTANYSPNDEMDTEDDDAIIGAGDDPGPGYGMQGPPLSPADRIYLNGAKSNKEYMARMVEIARRVGRRRELENPSNPIQTADDYVESLLREKKAPVEGEYGGPRIDATDEYMEGLGRIYRKDRGIDNDAPLAENRRTKTAPAGPSINPKFVANPNDSVAELESKMSEIEKEIQQVSQRPKQSGEESVADEVQARLDEMVRIRESQAVVEGEEDAVELSLEEGVQKVAELQRQIREAAGIETEPEPAKIQMNKETESESEPQSEPETHSGPEMPADSPQQSPVGGNPSTVDKQIEFLESYISKLQKEEVEDPEAGSKQDSQEGEGDLAEEMQTTMSDVAEQISKNPNERAVFQGLEDTPGEMSVEEKIAIFEQLKQKAANAQPSAEFADPFNVTLPESNTEAEDNDGDEPSPESEAEYDSFESSFGNKALLTEEIETEVKAFTRDVKALLQKHQTRLQVLLARLRAL